MLPQPDEPDGLALMRAAKGDPRKDQRWLSLRASCYKRDRAANARCWICGQAINYALKPSSSPDAYEPDHIEDVHGHPELAFDPGNIAASHRSCNRGRKTKKPDSMGEPSRVW